MGAQPFLEQYQTEQNLVIVMPAGGVLLVKLLHRNRAKKLINSRSAIQECVSQLIIHAVAEPIVHNVDREAVLRSFHNRVREKGAADLPVQPLPSAPSHLEAGRQLFEIFYNLFVEIRNTKFEAVGHGQFVGIHQQLIRESRSHFQN